MLAEPQVLTEDVVCVVPYKHRYDTSMTYYASKQNMVFTLGSRTNAQGFCQAIDDREFKKALCFLHVLDDKAFAREYSPEGNAYERKCGPHGDTLVQRCITDGGQHLFEAVLKKVDTDAVLKKGFSSFSINHSYANILHTIASHGDTAFLHVLTAIRPDLVSVLANTTDGCNMVPLRYAASTSNGELAEMLFGYTDKDKIRRSSLNGQSILDSAIVEKNDRLVELLLSDQSVADRLIRTTKHKHIAVLLAAAVSNYETFKVVYNAFDSRGLLKLKQRDNSMVLYHMITGRDGPKVCQFLKEHWEDTELLTTAIEYCGQTPLQMAARKGLGDVCELLYDTYASRDLLLDPIKKDGSTFFHKLISSVCEQTIENLLARPDFDKRLLAATNDSDFTAVHWAACGSYDIFVMLWNYCRQNDCLPEDGSSGFTMLMMAILSTMCDNIRIINLLLGDHTSSSLALDARNVEGHTALHFAVSENRPDICKILYDHMDSTQICAARTEDGMTALHMAIIANHGEVVEILMQDKTKSHDLIAATNSYDQTAYELATMCFPDVLRLFWRKKV